MDDRSEGGRSGEAVAVPSLEHPFVPPQVQMLLGALPRDEMLQQHKLGIFSELSVAMRTGSIRCDRLPDAERLRGLSCIVLMLTRLSAVVPQAL